LKYSVNELINTVLFLQIIITVNQENMEGHVNCFLYYYKTYLLSSKYSLFSLLVNMIFIFIKSHIIT